MGCACKSEESNKYPKKEKNQENNESLKIKEETKAIIANILNKNKSNFGENQKRQESSHPIPKRNEG